jgi:N,N'-diacetyllegionaminate synthase
MDNQMNNKVFIIAEAGVNHNGNIELAKKLVEVAANAGADAVKFQTFSAEQVLSKNAPKAEYQIKMTDSSESQFDMIKKLELDLNSHQEIIKHCNENNILFLSTPFDHESIEMLNHLNLPLFKIPSGEITNLPYLRLIGSKAKPVILSSGMATLGEIEFALNVLISEQVSLSEITVLHCNTDYPTLMKDVNLRAMQSIAAAFPGIRVGYSDHTLGIEVPIAAVSMGATVIEKHFTLDRNMDGPDHQASLEPDELKSMVKAIRNIEIAMGDGLKKPRSSEIKNKSVARKSIVAARNIHKGEVFTEENLSVKRPGTGLSPIQWDEVIEKKAMKDFRKDELISF